jgi:Mrp family chromosome partitioning ATPase
MGRTLEALRQGKRPALHAPEAVTPHANVAEEEVAEEPESAPFIEVGGPNRAVDGSPDVMACKLPAPVARSIAPAPKTAAVPKIEPKVEAAPAAPTDAGPWTVQFRPWVESRPPAVPMRRMAIELIAYHWPEHAVARQYAELLKGLTAQCPTGWGQVLLFTSPSPWGGTTTVLLNLAITAARQEGRRVAVVDANLRRPALADRLGLGAAAGLREVLAGSAPLAQALQETAQKNLWALAAGRSGTAGESRLPLDWLMPTLRQLRQQFDLVFVDAASWNEGSEVSALAATCDAVYMVLNQPQGSPSDSLPVLRQPPSNLQGCILTIR